MSDYGAHPPALAPDKSMARVSLPAGACKHCVYRVRRARPPLVDWDKCPACGVTQDDLIAAWSAWAQRKP